MGSKSKSQSSTSTTTVVDTRNLNTNLDGVEGTVVQAEGSNVNVTDQGAFELVGDTIVNVLDYVAESQALALEAVSGTTVKSLEKVNESNRSELSELINKAVVLAGIGAVAFVGAKYVGKMR